ncbi:MAG: hypothetical protein ACTSPI_00735 [Candidatus Heimdallarchaeaceae archaeon]
MSDPELTEYRIKAIGRESSHRKLDEKLQKIFVQLLETIGQEFESFEYYKYYKKNSARKKRK